MIGGWPTTPQGITPETEQCWSESNAQATILEADGEPTTTNPCGKPATTHLGLCAECYERITGKAPSKTAPLTPVVNEQSEQPPPY